MKQLLELSNVSKTYGSGKNCFLALQAITLTIGDGEFVAITGPSGAGKSTLLNIIGLIDTASSGTYHYEDQDVFSLKPSAAHRLRTERIAFVLQYFGLIPTMTVGQNIELPLRYKKVRARERFELVCGLAEKLGINELLRKYPGQLSIGQLQRSAVARALVTKPQLILADEPTGSLDSKNGDMVLDLLHAANQGGTAVIMVTHNEAIARRFGRRIELLDGRILSA